MTTGKSVPFTAWITKYALTSGIFSGQFQAIEGSLMQLIKRRHVGAVSEYYHSEGKEWHRTLEGALIRAEEMRTAKIESLEKKIESLEKQIKKLQSLSFTQEESK